MSNNEVLHTKDILDENNFSVWRKQLVILLKKNKLLDYIIKEKLKKIDGSSLTKDQKEKLIPVDETENTYFAEGTEEETVLNDTKAKEIIINSINSDLTDSIDFISDTAYEIYQMLSEANQGETKDRVEEIKESISRMKYDPEGKLKLSLFLSRMKLKFKELDNLKSGLDFKEKFNFLYNSIPEELAIKTNLISLGDNWEDVTKGLINNVQKLKEAERNRTKYNNEETNQNPQTNYNSTKDTKKTNTTSKEVECWYCKKKGHLKKDCWKWKKANSEGKGKGKKQNYKGQSGRQN